MSSGEVVVRAATVSDIDALAEMHARLLAVQLEHQPEPPIHPAFDARQYFARRLAEPLRWTLVAERDGQAVGYVDGRAVLRAKPSLLRRVARRVLARRHEAPLRMLPQGAYLANIFVAPEARGAGVGRALVRALRVRAREAGAEVMFSEVLAGNDASARFFERAGFAPEAVRYASPLSPEEDGAG